MTTFLPDSENFMFKRLGPVSGDIMGRSFESAYGGAAKNVALPREHTGEASPARMWDSTNFRAILGCDLVSFDQPSLS